MKRYILILCLLFFSFTVFGNTIKESLINTLNSGTSDVQKIETLTNLMDISRQQEQVDYAKLLYKEALKQNNDYHIEAALTEILRFYVNNDLTDSAKVYLEQAKLVLKGKSRDFLVTYMQTILDVRVVYYTQGQERLDLLEKYKFKLETGKDLPVLEKISINYLLGVSYGQRIEPGNEEEVGKIVRNYFRNVILLLDNIPLKYSYLFQLNAFNMFCLFGDKDQAEYALRYLNMQKEYAETKEMKKRPYVSKRHLLNAYSMLALTANALGKDLAARYFQQFLLLNEKYPEDAGFSAVYDKYFTSLNYFRSIHEYAKAVGYCDSIIHYFRYGDFKFDLTDNIVSMLKEKIDLLDSLHLYQEAFEAHKEYVVLLDSARMKNMQTKIEDLEIQKRVDELVIEKNALEINLQKSHSQLYLFFALFLLSVCSAIYIFFRLDKMKALYKELNEKNKLITVASEKAQESERMKNTFIKNMCHEVRTPLNAINGFAELITGDDLTTEEKQHFSQIIFTNCNHITSMVNDMLVIAQLDSSNEYLPLELVHIDLICQHEMDQLKNIQGKADIEYQVEGNKDSDLIYSNANHFGLIISHLLNNANKFTEKGNIRLSYKPDTEEKYMFISLTDTGCGIPKEKSEWIFERFTKNDDFVPGSGLGLYLCRLVAQRLKGEIYLDTDYTGGAKFILKLPINPINQSRFKALSDIRQFT